MKRRFPVAGKACKKSLTCLLSAAMLFLSPCWLHARWKPIGDLYPMEPGLREIDPERTTTIKWLGNIKITFTPKPWGRQRMRVSRGKKILFNREGRFWLFFEMEDFPYKTCKSLVVREEAEGHNPDHFIVLVRFPDNRYTLYSIDHIWALENVSLITDSGLNGSKVVQLTLGSWSKCADRFSFDRAAVFEMATLEWRLDNRSELPAFYRPRVAEAQAKIENLLRTSVQSEEEMQERKRDISRLVFDVAYYRYMMGDQLEQVAKELLGRFAFTAEETACAESMIWEVDQEVKWREQHSRVAERFDLGLATGASTMQ